MCNTKEQIDYSYVVIVDPGCFTFLFCVHFNFVVVMQWSSHSKNNEKLEVRMKWSFG